ncbi:MAG: hypothetical protein N3G48_01255 [Sulfolobales archaeon]|nr:hypothetical protein [Sulfolobales archaeon]
MVRQVDPYPSNVMSDILEAISTNGGTIKDRDLYDIIRKRYEITYSDFLRFIMILEVRGFIIVSTAREDIRIISLLTQSR